MKTIGCFCDGYGSGSKGHDWLRFLATQTWDMPQHMFELIPLGPHYTGAPDTFKLVHYDAQTAGK